VEVIRFFSLFFLRSWLERSVVVRAVVVVGWWWSRGVCKLWLLLPSLVVTGGRCTLTDRELSWHCMTASISDELSFLDGEFERQRMESVPVYLSVKVKTVSNSCVVLNSINGGTFGSQRNDADLMGT